MDRRQLEIFLAVVDYGSMSRAAVNLQVSQPSVSQTVRSLERKVRAPLFERKGSRLTLTAAGTKLVGPARQVLRDFEAASEAVAAIVDVKTGRLDITMPAILALTPGVPIISEYLKRYPNVYLFVADQTSASAAWDAVSDGTSEIGFTTTLEDPSLKAVLLGTHTLMAVLPPGSPHDGEPMALEEIADHRWITGPALGFSSRIHVRREMAARGLQMRHSVRIAHRQSIPELILAGVGASLMITHDAEIVRSRGAVVRPTEPEISRPFYLIHRPDGLSNAAKAFIATALKLAPTFGAT